jgi:hypothetical protein
MSSALGERVIRSPEISALLPAPLTRIPEPAFTAISEL